MRLLNTTTLELHEFFDRHIPKYAILSHRWEHGEVTFKDVTKKRNLEAPGWIKIKKSCDLALKRKLEWIWIDTCCIDKRSSAELSEAINSMYRWYRGAFDCYAYLNDVPCRSRELKNFTATGSYEGARSILSKEAEHAIRGSKWFSRGWTLQELLAPEVLFFIDKDWKGTIGSKISLAPLLAEITGISELVLRWSHWDWDNITPSIAERMSWALKRICSREEDVAYCLLGIFDVNMPLLYGEGGRTAFRRLQLEILKECNDESIFAWSRPAWSSWFDNTIGMLATSPSCFSRCSTVRSLDSSKWTPRAPYSMINRGMAFQTVLGLSPDEDTSSVIMPLRCYNEEDNDPSDHFRPLAVRLRPAFINSQDYSRILPLHDPDGGLALCQGTLLNREERCFVGKETLIYVEA